ncbi:MAG TPA: ATP-binding protein [Tepidisphaeraceae bacterium]|nr:ATP-binding protein [Tepidisphaeraceae bacterium]
MTSRPLVARLVLPFAAMIVIVVGASGVVVWQAGQNSVRAQQIHDLNRLVILVRGMLAADATQISPEQTGRFKDLATVLDTRITLIDGQGVVLFDSHHDPATMENHNDRPEVLDARGIGVGSSVRRSDTLSQEGVYVAQLLDPNNAQGMVVRLSYPQSLWPKVVPAWGIVLGAIASALLLMAVLGWILQRQWIGPLGQLLDVVERIAGGEWQARVQPAGDHAVRVLGGHFNVMAAQAEKRLNELSHQRADLQALVDALPDPILLSDSLGRIMVMNTPAARLLQVTSTQALGKKMDVVINEEAILRVIEGVSDTPLIREVRLQRNGQRVTYQAVASRSKAGGVLLVLRNVSALAATVQMKTDFVANASHELRTPIAAIKAAFETLQEVYREDPAQTDRCVNIIEGHLKRLEEMLTDLLDLSRVESPDLKPQISPVKADELFARLRATIGPMARDKNVELEFISDSPDHEMEFNSDRHLLELMLKNLVENSLKFTPSGGKVTVNILRTDGSVVLEVIDTGIGIPPEHQERVFERFYQVDAARSSAAGRGTGLGLAIVKHAIHALGGTVKLSSAVGVGTKVRCTFPLNQVSEDSVSQSSIIASKS